MSTKKKVIIVIVYTIVVVAVGRYLTPEKIKIETKIVEVEKKTEDKLTNKTDNSHKVTTTTETVKPNGEKVITTKVEEVKDISVQVDDKTKVVDNKSTDTIKEVVKGSSVLNISALGGISIKSKDFVYGAHITKDLLGPINIGVFGLSDGVIGGSIGVRF